MGMAIGMGMGLCFSPDLGAGRPPAALGASLLAQGDAERRDAERGDATTLASGRVAEWTDQVEG